MSEPEPFDAGQAAYTVTLPEWEGPLDLLLHLCQKHELDILNIPISFVTEKYLEYLGLMQLMQLDIAAEYLVMAATLAHIKSKMLLPAPPPGQEDEELVEEEDPREALIRRLLEYQKYKKAGADLAARGIAGKDVFYRGAPAEEAIHTGMAPLAEIPLYRLMEAFQSVLAKTKVRSVHDVTPDRISITDRIHELVDFLRNRKRIQFEQLFEGIEAKFDVVITFLAILEMARLRLTRLYQTDNSSPLWLESVDDDEAPPHPDVPTAPHADKETAPHVDEESTPHADEQRTPQADEESTPQADEESTPQADEESTPAPNDSPKDPQ